MFRHEIGHILGYRHEHIRPEAGCWGETGAWKQLTTYDAYSVMHYYCGNGGTISLTLSPNDKAGHALKYAAGT